MLFSKILSEDRLDIILPMLSKAEFKSKILSVMSNTTDKTQQELIEKKVMLEIKGRYILNEKDSFENILKELEEEEFIIFENGFYNLTLKGLLEAL